jgi:hypothetical protein
VIDGFASQPHYWDHLAPVWMGLGEHQGRFYCSGLLGDMPNTAGIPNRRIGNPGAGGPVLLAGYMDEKDTSRPVLYLEHGSGQTYRGDAAAADHPSYSGTPGHRRVILFICPGEEVAQRWRDAYPAAAVAVVGCPKLDRAHRYFAQHPWTPPLSGEGLALTRERRPVVAFTFHSDSILCPESRTAFPYYRDALPAIISQLRRNDMDVLGHGHPRLWRLLEPYWRSLGIEVVADLNDVFARADLLVGDNTSAMPEFASLGKPLVFLNMPEYRRDIDHGGRFWNWPAGQVSVDAPAQLYDGIIEALVDDEAHRIARERMVESIYVACDGAATKRAVDAIATVDPATAGVGAMAGPF